MKCTIKSTARALSLLLALVLLAGCSSVTPAATPTPEVTATPERHKTDDVLRIPMPAQVTEFDPLNVKYRMMLDVYGLIYDSFVRIDAERRVEPDVAQSWKFDTDTGVWAFTLQRGIRWQGDNRELNAYDVTYTLDRIMNENTIYTEAVKEEVAAYRVVDLYQVEITPKHEGLMLLYALDFPVVAKDSKAAGFTGLAGTGPYAVGGTTKSEGRQVLQLARSESSWRTKPEIARIECVAVTNEQDAFALYGSGRLDAMSVPCTFPSTFIQLGQTEKARYLTDTYEFLAVNHLHSALGRLPVRQAISYAVNTRSIIAQVYENAGVASDTPILPDSWLDRDDKMNYDFDLTRAEQLLEKDGWTDENGDGVRERGGEKLSVTILTERNETNRTHQTAADLIARMLEKAGIRAQVEAVSHTAFGTRLKEGSYDLALCSLSVGYSPDISDVFAAEAFAGCGYSFSQEKILIERLRAVREEEEFAALYSELQNGMLDRLPFIGLFFSADTFLYKDMNVTDGLVAGDVYRTIGEWTFR